MDVFTELLKHKIQIVQIYFYLKIYYLFCSNYIILVCLLHLVSLVLCGVLEWMQLRLNKTIILLLILYFWHRW